MKVRYTAAWNPQDQKVTVIRDVYAGISGPHGRYPAATLTGAEHALNASGYIVASTWTRSSNGSHWADLIHYSATEDRY